MLDHIAAFFHRQQEEIRYRAYVTDALKAVSENSTHYFIPGVSEVVAYGSYMPNRWYKASEEPKENTRTGDEIAEDIIRRAGLTIEGGNDNA